MPSKFQAMMEAAKQSMGVEDDTFRPTPSIRTDAMLGEIENFGRVVATYRTAVLTYAQRLNGLLQAYPSIARRNLPRVWDITESGGLPEPLRHDLSIQHPLRIGGDFDEARWEDSRKVLMKRLNGILTTADRWYHGLELARMRNSRLQADRLQVDAQRRVIHQKLRRLGVHDITQRELHLPATRPQSAGGEATEGGQQRPSSSPSVSPAVSPARIFTGLQDETSARKGDLARHVMQEQRKLDAVSASYYEQEQLLYEQLKNLAIESARFKSWVAATLLVVKEGMQGVLYAIGPCKLPLPGFSATRSGGDNGIVGYIDNLIQGIPDLPLEMTEMEGGPLAGEAAGVTPAKTGWPGTQPQIATPSYPGVGRGPPSGPATDAAADDTAFRSTPPAAAADGSHAPAPAFAAASPLVTEPIEPEPLIPGRGAGAYAEPEAFGAASGVPGVEQQEDVRAFGKPAGFQQPFVAEETPYGQEEEGY